MSTMVDFTFELTHFFNAPVVDVGSIYIAMSPFSLIKIDAVKINFIYLFIKFQHCN